MTDPVQLFVADEAGEVARGAAADVVDAVERERVPRRAITAGMRVLLAARGAILVVTGERKREILRRALAGPITPAVPASFLRTISNVRIYADRAAWSSEVPVARAS